jgi:hypothetical protein
MYVKKMLYLTMEQKNTFDEIQKEIEMNGGRVSCMRLLQDSIKVFLDHYQDQAIDKYSSNYSKKN